MSSGDHTMVYLSIASEIAERMWGRNSLLARIRDRRNRL
jgi:hypothetical protein